MTKHDENGFTIVELLIVIVVIGILAAITIVTFNGIQERARVSSLHADLRTMSQKARMKVVDGVTLSTGTWTTILHESDLYQSTRNNTEKSFSICWNAANEFAIIGFAPVKQSASVQEGDQLHAISPGGLKTITYSVADGTLVGGRACTKALPGYTSQAWSFNL